MYKKVCDFVDNTHTICTNFERIEFNLNISDSPQTHLIFLVY